MAFITAFKLHSNSSKIFNAYGKDFSMFSCFIITIDKFYFGKIISEIPSPLDLIFDSLQFSAVNYVKYTSAGVIILSIGR